MRGWALECRITAEDPYNDFRPSTGCITGLYEPTGPGVRLDSGIYEGFEVSPYYDSLIGKLVAWDETRTAAIRRMRRALEEYRIVGIKTSIPFHLELMNDPRFVVGQFDTTFVEEGFALVEEKLEDHLKVVAIATTLLSHQHRNRAQKVVPSNGHQPVSYWRMHGRWRMPGQWRV